MSKEIYLYGFERISGPSTQPLQDERSEPDGYCVYVTCNHEVEEDEDFDTLEEARTFAGTLMLKYPRASYEEYSIPLSQRTFFP